MKSTNKLLNNSFSHIYIEKEAYNFPMTSEILSKFKNAVNVEIDDYKKLFSRTRQNFILQKRTPKLILAVKKDKYLYEGAKVCESFGNENFYYISSVLNCVYDCEYCYLQGVYSSANIVVFVNIEDMFDEVKEVLKEKSMYICISYDTDLLAMENVLGIVKKWYEFSKEHSNLKIELRTKSANISLFSNLKANPNFIVAWTLSPEEIAQKYENGTPELVKRVDAAAKLIKNGWTVRLCFDPTIYTENFKEIYGNMVEYTFSKINSKDILDISIGTFRISKEYLKRMKKNRENSKILYYPFECRDGVYSYPEDKMEKMLEFMRRKVLEFADKDKIFI